MKKLLSLASLLFLLFQAPVFAGEYPASPDSKSSLNTLNYDDSSASKKPKEETKFDKYLQACMDKLDYGTPNILVGWTNLISEPMNYSKKEQDVHSWKKSAGYVSAFLKGLVLFPIDEVGGALNVATFPIPAKIPIPQNGVDVRQVG